MKPSAPASLPPALSPLRLLACLVIACWGLAACGSSDPEEEEGDEELTNATFELTSTNDCVVAFDDFPFLQRAASKRGWGVDEISSLCDDLQEISNLYVDDATLTTVVIAAVGQANDGDFEASYYVGASGYNMTAVREWLVKVNGAQAIRQCTTAAAVKRRTLEGLPEGYVRDCLEDKAGEAYPAPLFQERYSEKGLDEVGDAGAGAALGLAIYNAPGLGTVVAFLGGGFYAQASPAYGAFFGCGAAIGFTHDASAAGATAPLCLGAAY